MNTKLMLAIATLLGFSTACSSVKNTSKEGRKSPKEADSQEVAEDQKSDTLRVMVMYGVPMPKLDSTGKVRMQPSYGVEDLTPVYEKAHEEEDPKPAESPAAPAGK